MEKRVGTHLPGGEKNSPQTCPNPFICTRTDKKGNKIIRKSHISHDAQSLTYVGRM